MSNKYINIKSDYYLYGDSEYIIQKQRKLYKNSLISWKKLYNGIDHEDIKKYIYFINKDSSIDFSSNDYNSMNKLIKKNFEADYYGFFNINSFEEYKKYFYQTDHHWNYLGSYKGYTEIIRLLLGEDEKLLEPISTIESNYIFNGSRSRQTSTFISDEFFTVYEFPELFYTRYDTTGELGTKQFYLEEGKIYENYYTTYYGSQWNEMIYDFDQDEKENLLVISNSYVYPIDDLIASHFNKTFYFYVRWRDEVLDEIYFHNYIEKNDIDKVLIIGDIHSFALD